MFCVACLSRATRAARGMRARCSGAGDGERTRAPAGLAARDSPLRNLLDDASAFGEARPEDAELQWATLPYAAAPSERQAALRVDPRETTVLLFPGQGAEHVGMGRQLKDVPAARQLYDLASEVLGWDVWRVCTEGPAAELARRVQPCVLVTSLAALERARDERPGAVAGARAAAGFSLGELAALVAAGALRLEDALRFAELRAAAMAAAAAERPGGMLTVWLAPDAELPHALLRAREHAAERGVAGAVCAVANYLFPGCKVVAGDEAALAWLEREGARFGVRRAARVRVAGAFHCALMERTRAPLAAALRALDVRAPRLAVWACTEAARYADAGHVRRGLARLAARPVRWEQTLQALYARPRGLAPPRTLALGPGAALRSTLRHVNARAWDSSLQVHV
ncbi:probable malonyl-CoA-acyl carrier protein transacylase, mitochondrial [Pectinophora gossypiella]|uniref:probable malonyl-CoA-acyl carrier protein transacylase, mitochondrial n=1 Tax=Pectinophora gossypiella TaxID=13191 RepID=UPI00214F2D1E|nr:probable malonyl-CoA-acyl carrier protein transacylase, mitochondrial [Pectinophora gossypiella]